MSNSTVTLRRRVVQRNKDGLYYVYAARSDGRLAKTGTGSPHHTVAMAKLGRLVQADTVAVE